jgi:hypothetical protein
MGEVLAAVRLSVRADSLTPVSSWKESPARLFNKQVIHLSFWSKEVAVLRNRQETGSWLLFRALMVGVPFALLLLFGR